MSDLLRENERLDDLHIKGYQIIQHPEKFCFSMDAVLLSSFAKVNEGNRVLDLGTGTGIIPILLEAKTKGYHFTGLEIQSESCDMARRSVQLNGIDSKIDIVAGDIKSADELFPLSSFDVITSNPPYMDSGKGLVNPTSAKAIARHEVLCNLEDLIRVVSKLLKVKGHFFMVHRPHRVAEIIHMLRMYKLEPKCVRFVHPYIYKDANMVLIEAVRHGNKGVLVKPPLIVYKEQSVYTDEIYDIYGYER